MESDGLWGGAASSKSETKHKVVGSDGSPGPAGPKEGTERLALHVA